LTPSDRGPTTRARQILSHRRPTRGSAWDRLEALLVGDTPVKVPEVGGSGASKPGATPDRLQRRPARPSLLEEVRQRRVRRHPARRHPARRHPARRRLPGLPSNGCPANPWVCLGRCLGWRPG